MEKHNSKRVTRRGVGSNDQRALKWKEQAILDAIRAKGYKADEIVVRFEE